jgi:serine/threonine-protein kinase
VIRLRILGPIELVDSYGRPLESILAQPKRTALLAYLAARAPAGVFHRRDALLALFWPELDESHARSALNQAIRFLRRELRDEKATVIVSRGAEELGLAPTGVWCDVSAMRQCLDEDRFGDALALYRGDLLAGFFADAAGFEEWLEVERTRLRAGAARAARALAEARERDRNYTTAVANARRAVELSDADERIVRELLELMERLGDRAGAIRAYEDFARRLAEEYDAEPAADTRALIERIRSADPPSRATLPRPSDADTWEVIRELGRGGMATVYLARDTKHDRQVALKVMRPELALSLGPERFLREIQLTARLAHPHILPLIDSGARDGQMYLVTPYVSGESLRARLEREHALPLDDARRLAREVAEALEYAHRSGIVHRDIKPENILLADGHAIVADFGVARALASSGTSPTAEMDRGMGSPSYMSPEARDGGVIDARADVYSLGRMLCEMLTGELPDCAHAADRLRAAHVPKAIVQLIAECLESEAQRRPSAAAVLRRLESPAAPVVGRTRVTSAIERPWTWAAVAMLIVATTGAAWWYRGRVASGAAIDPSTIALFPFRVSAPDTSYNYLGEGMAELLAPEFTGAGSPRAIDPGTAFRVWDRVRGTRGFVDRSEALRIAGELGAGQLLEGTIVASGRRVSVTATIVASSGAPAAPVTVEGSADSLAPLVANLATRLLARGTEAWRSSANAPGSTSPEAVRAFVEGRQSYRRGTGEAIRLFGEAIDIDSTFVQAAYWLSIMAGLEDGVPAARREQAYRLAWQDRARLSEAQRQLLQGIVGPSGPSTPVGRIALHRALERATIAHPGLPEGWQLLGDSYLHYGALMGFDDWASRARLAFERAYAIDSLYGSPGHLALLAFMDRDRKAFTRWTQRLESRRGSVPVVERWLEALITGTDADRTQAREAFARAGGQGGWPWAAGVSVPRDEVDLLVGRVAALATNENMRRQASRFVVMIASNGGQPERAGAARAALFGRDSVALDLDVLIWAEPDAPAAIERLSRAVRDDAVGSIDWSVRCELMLARLRAGDTTDLSRTLVALRDTAPTAAPASAPSSPRQPNAVANRERRVCANLAEAIGASLTSRTGMARLIAADSMMRVKPWGSPLGEMHPHWNYDLALALARHNAWGAAAAAARRRLFGRPARFAVSLRDEGRWSMLAGDTANAVRAWTRYLDFRTAPEPVFSAEVSEVRRSLASLRGDASRR